MNNVPFTLSQVRPIRDAMTVSRPSGLGYGVPVTWFSLGAGTSITPEYYDCTTLYLGGEGNGKFLLGVDGQEVSVKPGEVLYVPPKTLCGTKTDSGTIYTEIILKKENFTMNNIIKAGQPTELKELISYEEGSIANLDIAHLHLCWNAITGFGVCLYQYDRYRLSYGMAFGLVVIFISSLNAQKITNAIFRGKGL